MKKRTIIVLTAVFALNVQAQTLRTSYFMDKYHLRHQRNPALSPSMGYVNVIGNIQANLQTNMKLSDFLYPGGKDGGLKTFLHEDVSSKEFLKKIGRGGATIGADVNVCLLGFGFYTKENRFWSADLNVKAHGGINIPKDFFDVLKNADFSDGHEYNFKNLNAAGRGYLELAIGHARDIGKDFRVGVKLKGLVGLVDGRVKFDDFSIYSSQSVWKMRGQGEGSLLGNFVEIEEDDDGKIKGLTSKEFQVSELIDYMNFGGALDLGVSYNLDRLLGALIPIPLLQGFTASFSITDLGYIRYKKSAQVTIDETVEFTGVKITHSKDEDGKNTFNGDINYITDRFEDMMSIFHVSDGDGGAISRGLRTTTNLGLEYSFFNDKMSAGLLWSTHYGLPKVFNEMTLSYNLRPVRWYSLSLSTSFAHGFFRTAGWAMNFTPKYGLNFFFGMDYVPFAWTPKIDGLPIGLPVHNFNTNFNFGMSIPLGGNRSAQYDGTKRERKKARREEKEFQQTIIHSTIE
jgi:hypothetical protein